MPHFVIDCALRILRLPAQEEAVIRRVHGIAVASGLFAEADIKVRVNRYVLHVAGSGCDDFIHVFCHIMEGRSIEQRSMLTRAIVTELAAMFPDVPYIAANVYEFENATYCNRAMS